MKKFSIAFTGFAMFIAVTGVFAQQKEEKTTHLDEVFISATKFKLEKEKVGKVIYKITQKEIQENTGKSVAELINNVTGVEIKGANSNKSENLGVYIRGGRNRQVLVLIDGVPVSDPTGISQEYDLRMLSLNQIESIEILKGAASTLYGSGAAAGVINITLKKGGSDKFSGSYEVGIGTNNSVKNSNLKIHNNFQNINLRGSLNHFNYLASVGVVNNDGLSSAKSTTQQIFETDAYHAKNGLLKLGYQLNAKIALETFVSYNAFNYEFDAGAYTDSKTDLGNQKQWRIGVKPTVNYRNGNAYILASVNTLERSLNNSHYKGKSVNIDAVNRYNFSKIVQLITGLNYQNHNNKTDTPYEVIDKNLANFNTFDIYGTLVYSTAFGMNISAGARLNTHSKYGNYTVYNINPSYTVYKSKKASVKLLTSYSTAYIAPSLYQLFSAYGNLNLRPETNATFEFGFESTYKNWLEFNTIFFNRTENNTIIFKNLSVAPWGQYDNGTQTITAKGIESDLIVKPSKTVKIHLGYAYVDKSAETLYIPKYKITGSLELNPLKNTSFLLSYKTVGKRTGVYYDNTSFQSVEKTLPAYSLFDASLRHAFFNRKLNLFGSVSNLFNEDYEETLGYNTRGQNFLLGVIWKF